MLKRALHFQRKITGDSLLGTARRYFVFVFGGFLGWAIIAILYLFFNRILAVQLFFAYAVGLIFADIATFVYHRLLTFNIKTNWKERFIKFSVLVIIISLFNWFLFYLIVGVLEVTLPQIRVALDIAVGSSLHLTPALVVASDVIVSFLVTTVLSLINFGVNRLFIFRHH